MVTEIGCHTCKWEALSAGAEPCEHCGPAFKSWECGEVARLEAENKRLWQENRKLWDEKEQLRGALEEIYKKGAFHPGWTKRIESALAKAEGRQE